MAKSSYRKIKQCRNCRGTLRIHAMKFAATRSNAAADLPHGAGRPRGSAQPSSERCWAPARASVLNLLEPSPKRFGGVSPTALGGCRSHSRSSAGSLTSIGMHPMRRRHTNGSASGLSVRSRKWAREEARNAESPRRMVIAQDKESTVRRPEVFAIARGIPQYSESVVLCLPHGREGPSRSS